MNSRKAGADVSPSSLFFPLLLLLLTVFLYSIAFAEDPVHFNDPNLKAAVEDTLCTYDRRPQTCLV